MKTRFRATDGLKNILSPKRAKKNKRHARAGVSNTESDENDENGSIRFREMSLFVRNTSVVSHIIPEDEELLL